MVSRKIKRQAKEWAEAIKSLSKTDQVRAAVLLRNDLLSKYSKTYVRSCLTEFRKSSKSAGLRLHYHLRISKKDQKKITKTYAADLSKAHHGLRWINDPEGMVAKAVAGLSSDNVYIVAVCLILITGRRPVEILKTARFTPVRGDNSQLIFEGQTKTKDRYKGPYAIPVLGKAAPACIRALKKVRKEMDCTELSNDETKQKYNDKIAYKPTKLFKDYLGRCTPRDLRKAYAAILVHHFLKAFIGRTAPNKSLDTSVNAYIASILGHWEEDIETANSYIKYRL